jgi:hypothetical protein
VEEVAGDHPDPGKHREDAPAQALAELLKAAA